MADSILAQAPTDPYSHSLKTVALRRLGHLKEARTMDDAVLARLPNDWGAQSSMANVCYEQVAYACAATMARSAVAQQAFARDGARTSLDDIAR